MKSAIIAGEPKRLTFASRIVCVVGIDNVGLTVSLLASVHESEAFKSGVACAMQLAGVPRKRAAVYTLPDDADEIRTNAPHVFEAVWECVSAAIQHNQEAITSRTH